MENTRLAKTKYNFQATPTIDLSALTRYWLYRLSGEQVIRKKPTKRQRAIAIRKAIARFRQKRTEQIGIEAHMKKQLKGLKRAKDW
jgi:hypothetical protein